MLALIVVMIIITTIVKILGRVLEFGMDLLLFAGILIAFAAMIGSLN
jgi:hypothetical protein